MIKNKTWEGQIYRADDNKKLFDDRLKFSNDSLYIFANAIFGADNDTLILPKNEGKLNINIYRYEILKFLYQYKIEDKIENFYLTGNYYYIVLEQSKLELSNPTSLNFYQNISAPRRAIMYLDDAYEGEIEFVFLDGFSVKRLEAHFGVANQKLKIT